MSLESGTYTIAVNDGSNNYLGLDDGQALVVTKTADDKWEVTKTDDGYDLHAYDNPNSIYVLAVKAGTPLTGTEWVSSTLFQATAGTDPNTYQMTVKDASSTEFAWQAGGADTWVTLEAKSTDTKQFWLFKKA